MRTVRILTYDQANLLDVAGPAQVFASASQYAVRLGQSPAPVYDIAVVTREGGLSPSSASVTLDTARASLAPVDTFIVAGGFGADAARGDGALIDFIRRQAGLSRRTGSVCTGAFLLAEAGLLDGRRATTHWAWCEEFARDFPKVTVDADAVYTEDGPVWTSAGVLAGVDMSMAMIERDLGARMAQYTARALVAVSRRSSGEPQISARLAAQEVDGARIRRLMEWIMDNPSADLSTQALAGRACLSVRSLQRHFSAEAGETPAVFVERARVEFARRLLATTDMKLDAVAVRSGFASVSTMQRAFARLLGQPPGRFRSTLAAAGRQRLA